MSPSTIMALLAEAAVLYDKNEVVVEEEEPASKRAKLLESQDYLNELLEQLPDCPEAVELELCALLEKEPHLAQCPYTNLLELVAQHASLETVLLAYSLNPKAIQTCPAAHAALSNADTTVLQFLLYQHPQVLMQTKPFSLVHAMVERIVDGLELLQFGLSICPKALFVLDQDSNTLLHTAAHVTSQPYPGPRTHVLHYLLPKFPQAARLSNVQGQLPLHRILQTRRLVPRTVTLQLLLLHPSAALLPWQGLLPLEWALHHQAPAQVLLSLPPPTLVFQASPQESPELLEAQLRLANPNQTLALTKYQGPYVSQAVTNILYSSSQRNYQHLHLSGTPLSLAGMVQLLTALTKAPHGIVTCHLRGTLLGILEDETDEEDHEVGWNSVTEWDYSQALEQLLQQTNITFLDLSDNELPNDPGWLLPLLSHTSQLKSLHLGRNIPQHYLSALIPIAQLGKLHELQVDLGEEANQVLLRQSTVPRLVLLGTAVQREHPRAAVQQDTTMKSMVALLSAQDNDSLRYDLVRQVPYSVWQQVVDSMTAR